MSFFSYTIRVYKTWKERSFPQQYLCLHCKVLGAKRPVRSFFTAFAIVPARREDSPLKSCSSKDSLVIPDVPWARGIFFIFARRNENVCGRKDEEEWFRKNWLAFEEPRLKYRAFFPSNCPLAEHFLQSTKMSSLSNGTRKKDGRNYAILETSPIFAHFCIKWALTFALEAPTVFAIGLSAKNTDPIFPWLSIFTRSSLDRESPFLVLWVFELCARESPHQRGCE